MSKKIIRKTKRIFLTSGMLASMLLLNPSSSFARNADISSPGDIAEVEVYTESSKSTGIKDISSKLGLSPEEVMIGLNSGKKFTDILEENNISLKRARKVVGNGRWPTARSLNA